MQDESQSIPFILQKEYKHSHETSIRLTDFHSVKFRRTKPSRQIFPLPFPALTSRFYVLKAIHSTISSDSKTKTNARNRTNGTRMLTHMYAAAKSPCDSDL